MGHPSLMARSRRHLATVVVALLVAALVPLASPAGAQPAPAPDLTDACEHAGTAGFTDIAGTGFADVIDCLAAFGVTTGTTATTYSPAVQVRRSQMALFYFRIGEMAGIDWDTSSAGFTDLGGLNTQFVTAINALANAGVVNGTTATTFDPQSRIRRSQMALFIDRFQELLTGFGYSDGLAPGDLFPDIATLSAEARAAVNGIGSAGITQGDAAGNFVPSGFVSRQQMAAFVVRHLAANGFVAPAPTVTGMLVALRGDTNVETGLPLGAQEYQISTGTEIVTITVGDDDTFSLGGVAATQTVFNGFVQAPSPAATPGHLVTFTPGTTSSNHDLVPTDLDDRLAMGLVVGDNLDIISFPGGEVMSNADEITADLIEPISGVPIVDYTDVGWDDVDVYRVGGSTATEAAFIAAIGFGDTLTVTENASGARFFSLTNQSVIGFIADPGDASGGGGSFSLSITVAGVHLTGNDLNGSDTNFTVNAPVHAWPGNQQLYTLDGVPVAHSVLEDRLTNLSAADVAAGVRVVYSRTANTERFDVTTEALPAPGDPEPGSITGTYVGGSGHSGFANPFPPPDFIRATLQIIVGSTIYGVEMGPATVILVDGVLTDYTEIDTALAGKAGAQVTVLLADEARLHHAPTNVAEAVEPGDQVIISSN